MFIGRHCSAFQLREDISMCDYWATKRILLLSVLVVGTGSNLARGQATDVNFLPTAPATWNLDGNWDPDDNGGFIPAAFANEIGVISAAQTAFVDGLPPNTGGIIINSGSLEIRSTGSLTAVPDLFVEGNLAVNGIGTLSVMRGGMLNVRNMTAGASSLVTLGETAGSGTATLQVTGGTLAGRTRVIGPNVAFSSAGGLTFTGSSVIEPVITGGSHSTITATGSVTAAGVIRPEFTSLPTLGTSWNIVSGSSLGGQFTLDSSMSSNLPRGTGLALSQSSTTVTLDYANRLILQVDRNTGATSMLNAIGDPIVIDGFSASSTSGSLGGTWTPLPSGNGWDVADNVDEFRFTQYNPESSSIVSTGSPMSLGTPYAPETPAAFGDVVGEDVAFQYTTPIEGANPGTIVDGIVEYVGGNNNIVLTIDPTSGNATLQNESPYFDVAIDAYTIRSQEGRLLFANGGWNSLDDQNTAGWEQADNVDSSRVTEFNPMGQLAMAGGGTIFTLGHLVDETGAPLLAQNFSLEFSTVGGAVGGDYNDDGIVDAADYTVWRDNQGSGATLPNDDTPGVGADDYTRWRANFGLTGSGGGQIMEGIVTIGPLPTPGSLIGGSAVPEPSTWAIGMLMVGIIAISTKPLRSIFRQ
jgi:hypothetical protein